MVEDRDEVEPLSDEEIEALRSHLGNVAFRERVGKELKRYIGWLSASIITGFAIYKAIVDVLFKKAGS